MNIHLDSELIKNYFDNKAESWNNNSVDDNKLDILFNKGSYFMNADILDIGCGTGILFDYYLNHNCKSITGIDISTKMIEIASKKNAQANLICGDAINYIYDKKFDVIVIFNSLPHISNVDLLLMNCKKHMHSNSKLIIAFDNNVNYINKIHDSVPSSISFKLPNIEELKNICLKYFNVIDSTSNSDIYEIICINRT